MRECGPSRMARRHMQGQSVRLERCPSTVHIRSVRLRIRRVSRDSKRGRIPHHTERIGSFRPEYIVVAMPLMASRAWPGAPTSVPGMAATRGQAALRGIGLSPRCTRRRGQPQRRHGDPRRQEAQITQGGAEVLTAALQDGTVTRHTDIRTGEPILMTLDLRGAGLLKGRPRFLRDKRRAFRYV